MVFKLFIVSAIFNFLHLYDSVSGYTRNSTDNVDWVTLVENRLQTIEANVIKLKSLKNDISNMHLQFSHVSNGGAVYTRWGRKVCPLNDTKTVYTGYAGGGWHDNSGAASEYVCLPSDPDVSSRTGTGNAYIYGAEYRMSFGPKANSLNDVPCTVCLSTRRRSVIMVPGKNKCHRGWHMEYHGTLATGIQGSKSSSSYICIDEEADSVNHGVDDDKGKYVVDVRVQCGSLPCPPYVNTKRLLCVVCSK